MQAWTPTALSIGLSLALLITALVGTLAMPILEWRTGDQGLAPLTYAPSQARLKVPQRLWIDTDAACGHNDRTDPDDCFAIALLTRAPEFQVVGISTVFGNAPLDVVDRTTHELASKLSEESGQLLRVYSGSATSFGGEAPISRPQAHDALAAALETGPLSVVALGPLTNLSAVLHGRPELRSRIAQLVTVMSRRPGHIFHPAEGAGGGILFGHGPVFRDFNFMMDVRASERIISMNLPLTLIPYDAARGVEINADDLDRLRKSDNSIAWIADRARSWLRYWQKDIGRQGFYPFDLIAAAYVMEPSRFLCASVEAWVGKDQTLFIPFWRPTALLVSQNYKRTEKIQAVTSGSYCAKVSPDIKDLVMDRLAS
jgi:purine nucleosidase